MGLAADAAFHRQLASLLRAGLPQATAIEHAGIAGGGWWRGAARTLTAGSAAGRPLWQQLAELQRPAREVALVRAGEVSGRLPELLDRLAEHAEHRRRLRGLLIGRLIYPTFLAHVALAAPGLPRALLQGEIWAILVGPLTLWATVAAALGLLFALRHSGFAARLVLAPGFSLVSKPWIAADILPVVEAALTAGMLNHEALELAADSSGNRVVAARLHACAADLLHARRELGLSAALAEAGIPLVAVRLLQAAEIGGKLDDGLRRAGAWAREEAESRSIWAARIAAGLGYALAVIGAGMTVIGMFQKSYLGPISEWAKETE